jgi:hypothetical protein
MDIITYKSRLNNIIIKFFTFNLGDYNKSILLNDSIRKQFESEIPNVFEKAPNIIWIVSTQEDKSRSSFIHSIKKYMTSKSKDFDNMEGGALNNNDDNRTRERFNTANSSSNNRTRKMFNRPRSIKRESSKPTSSNSSSSNNNIKYSTIYHKNARSNVPYYDVQLAIFAPYNIRKLFEVGKTLVQYHSDGITGAITKSKSSIVMNLKIKIGTYHNLIIVASHLPINSSDSSTLGYKVRQDAMAKLMNRIYAEYMNQTYFTNTSMIWLGDLNFRLKYYNEPNSDQILTTLLKQTVSPFNYFKLQDFTNITNFNPTCKTSTKDEKASPECISTYTGTTISNDVANKCYKIHNKSHVRIPSYCDRILGWNSTRNKYNLAASDVKPIVENFTPALYSDHNPITGSLVLTK